MKQNNKSNKKNNKVKMQNYSYKKLSTEEKKEREDDLIVAFMNKNHEYLLERFDPLYKRNLTNIPSKHHDDFLQEFWIETIRIVEKNDFSKKIS